MLNATEMLEGLSKYAKSPALYLYPWVLASIVWMKSSGFQSDQIPFDIPVVPLYDFSHPDKITEKDFPYATDGERYYFTKQVPLDASGKKSKRKAGEEGAHWKSTSKDIKIQIPDSEGKPILIGYMRKYTLYDDMDGKRSANWYMEEYRVLDPDGLADHYVLCKIYDKESRCPKFTRRSVETLTERFFERQLGSHPDQTNSQFDNMNESQTQFDDSNFSKDLRQSTFHPLENIPPQSILPNPGPASYSNEHAGFSDLFSMSHEHINMQPTLPTSVHRKKNKRNNFAYFCSSERKKKTTLPTSENFPRESILPIPGHPCCSNEFPMYGDISTDFSMSRDLSGNLNPPESIRPIPGPPDYSNGFSMSHDLSGNLNPAESTLPIPGRPCCSNEFPMYGDISNDFSMSRDLSGNLNPPESIRPIPGPPDYSNGFSMSHDLSGNLNLAESTLPIPGRPCCSNEFPMYGDISNDFSMSRDLSGNLNAPDGEESPLDCHSQLWNHENL